MKWGTLKERGILHGNYICIVHLNSNENSRKKWLLFRFYEQRHPRKNKYMILLAVLAHKWISAKNSFPFSVSASSKSWITFLLYPFNKMMCLFFSEKQSQQILTLLGGLEWVTSNLSQKGFILFSTRWRIFSTSPTEFDFSKKNTSPPVSRNFCESRTSFLPGGRLSRFASLGSSLYHLLHWSGSNATFALVNDSENCNDKPGWIYSFVSDLRTARNNSPWLYGFVEVRSTHFKQQRTPREKYYPWKDGQKKFNSILPNFIPHSS